MDWIDGPQEEKAHRSLAAPPVSGLQPRDGLWVGSDNKAATVGENGVGHRTLGVAGVLPAGVWKLWLQTREKPHFCEGTRVFSRALQIQALFVAVAIVLRSCF